MKEIKQADTRKTTHLLKKHFKEVFGIKTSIKTEKYSMGCSMNISYDLGPDVKQVKEIASKLQYSYFDGMQDMSVNVDNDGLIIDGYQLEDWKHVFVDQSIPNELEYKMAKFFSDNHTVSGAPKLENFEQWNENFKERVWAHCWTWNHLFSNLFQTRNFATQDPEKINLISCGWSEDHNGEIYFIYEVDGVEYNTEKLPSLKTSKKSSKEPNFKKVDTIPGEVNLVDYSERAFAVIGDTKPIKDELRKLGGKFNYRLSCGAGWIFSKSKLESVTNFLQNHSKQIAA